MSRASLSTVAAMCLVSSCRPAPEPRAPVFLASEARAASHTFRDETRRAFDTPPDQPLELTVVVPQRPRFRFSIAASTMGAPVLASPVTFRIHANGALVFEEIIRRSRPNRWHSRELDLSDFAGNEVRLTFEASTGAFAKDAVLPLWGNPVLVDLDFEPPPERPDVILVSIDCLRADHLGVYGYERDTSPNVDALAREASVFENAMATSSYTLPTHASMLTGLLPSFHGAAAGRRIASSVAYAPELLADAGYRVDGIVSAPFLSSVYGFERGFHTYRLMSARAASLVDEAIALLHRGEGQSQFLFFHLFDAHMPYTPPREFRDRFRARPEDITSLLSRVEKRLPPASQSEIDDVVSLYDGEVAYIDRELGRLFDYLRESGRYEDALIVVTADHGEAFHEHGTWEHARPWEAGPGLYDEVLRVPLIVKWPHATTAERAGDVVSQTDIFPTLLTAAGLSPPTSDAIALEETSARRTVYAEFVPRPDANEARRTAVRRGRFKYLTGPEGEELYDLENDPGERVNLAAGGHLELTALGALAKALEARALESAPMSEEVTMDEALRERLEALGYIER